MTAYRKSKWRVDAPDWTHNYKVGDEITFFHPGVSEMKTEEIVGWSTYRGNRGLPVVEPDWSDSEMAIQERFVQE